MGPAKEEAAEAAATEAPPAPASCYPECSGGGYDWDKALLMQTTPEKFRDLILEKDNIYLYLGKL